MNLYPQQSYQQEAYYPTAAYWTAQFQGVISVVVSIAVAVAMGAWALSLVKKALKGEEVKFPL
jgi:hypothetical protein